MGDTIDEPTDPTSRAQIINHELLDESAMVVLYLTGWCVYANIHNPPEDQIQ